MLLVFLKHKGKVQEPVISKIKRTSAPGSRVCADSKNLPRALGNLGVAIVSTSKGVITNFKANNLALVVKFHAMFGNWRFCMSRIGNSPIKTPESVDFVSNENILTVKGKFGTLERTIPDVVEIEKNDHVLIVGLSNQTRTNRTLHGSCRTLMNYVFIGISEQFELTLILKGVGHRAPVQNKLLTLSFGHSHPVEIAMPEETSVEILKNATLNLKGCDKENVGLLAANVRSWRPPEPYKGKDIVCKGEIVKRKAGESGKK